MSDGKGRENAVARAQDENNEVLDVSDPIPAHEVLQEMRTERVTRDWLTRVVAIGILVALAIAGVVAGLSGSSTPISAVWAVVGPILGGMIDYYYHHGKDRRTN